MCGNVRCSVENIEIRSRDIVIHLLIYTGKKRGVCRIGDIRLVQHSDISVLKQFSHTLKIHGLHIIQKCLYRIDRLLTLIEIVSRTARRRQNHNKQKDQKAFFLSLFFQTHKSSLFTMLLIPCTVSVKLYNTSLL